MDVGESVGGDRRADDRIEGAERVHQAVCVDLGRQTEDREDGSGAHCEER